MTPNYSSFTTVEQIATFVRNKISLFRQFPTRKNEVVEQLTPIFEINSPLWPIVIDSGKFRVTFRMKLGKRGMISLKKILMEIDSEHYQEIDFEEE